MGEAGVGCRGTGEGRLGQAKEDGEAPFCEAGLALPAPPRSPAHAPVSSAGWPATSAWKAAASWFQASWLCSSAATPAPPPPRPASCGEPLREGLPPAAAVACRAGPVPAERRRAASSRRQLSVWRERMGGSWGTKGTLERR